MVKTHFLLQTCNNKEPSILPGPWWFSTATVEGDHRGACKSRGGADSCSTRAGPLGRGPAGEPSGGEPGRQDGSLPIRQKHNGPPPHQRPCGAQVDLLLSYRGCWTVSLYFSFYLTSTVTSFCQVMGHRPAEGSVCTGVYICGPRGSTCCRRASQRPHLTLLHRALRKQQIQTHAHF